MEYECNFHVFGNLLQAHKPHKTFVQLQTELGFNPWAYHPDRYGLPLKDKLPKFAAVYGIPLAELEAAYKKVKDAQEAAQGRRPRQTRCIDVEAHAGIASPRKLSLTNSQVTNHRFGRQ